MSCIQNRYFDNLSIIESQQIPRQCKGNMEGGSRRGKKSLSVHDDEDWQSGVGGSSGKE